MSTRPSASNKTRATILVVGLGALLSGCGGSTSGGSCTTSSDCVTDGDACNPNTSSCTQVCQQALCPASSECSSYFGTCVPVSCGQYVQCADPGSFCYLESHECYPSSGKCIATADCPLFDGRVAKATTLACKDGFCQVDSAPPPVLTQAQNAAAVPIISPMFGAQVASADALQFQWDGSLGATSIALVLTDLPQDLSQVLTTAVWGRVLPADAEPVARWQDGVAIQGGQWQASSAAVPSGPLYFLVQAVRAGKLVGISTLTPFRVGSAWPAVYSRCGDNNVLPGSCANPNRPQICWGGFCRLLCASHIDCKSDQSSLCGTPSQGVRICG